MLKVGKIYVQMPHSGADLRNSHVMYQIMVNSRISRIIFKIQRLKLSRIFQNSTENQGFFKKFKDQYEIHRFQGFFQGCGKPGSRETDSLSL